MTTLTGAEAGRDIIVGGDFIISIVHEAAKSTTNAVDERIGGNEIKHATDDVVEDLNSQRGFLMKMLGARFKFRNLSKLQKVLIVILSTAVFTCVGVLVSLKYSDLLATKCLVSDQCQNGGACVDTIDRFYCSCLIGFVGIPCEDVLDIKSDAEQNFLNKSLEVLHNLSTTNTHCDFRSDFCDTVNETSLLQYHNQSISAFQINSSDSAVPLCSKESCLNGGTCIEKGEEISCECAAGFIGESCADIECALPGTCNSAVTKPVSCKCRIDYVKDARDPAKCQSSNSDNATLLFLDDAGIQQISTSQRNTTRILLDTSLGHALDFHYPTKTMFWSGPHDAINSAPISAGASKTLVITNTSADIRSIAIDWVHHHLYYTDAYKDKISVANLDGSMTKVLVNDGLSYPSSIVVNPLNGWMYWVDGSFKKIERAGMDGSRRKTIATSTDYPWGLAIDCTENRLYWTTNWPHPCSIHSMNTDGLDQILVLRAAAPTFSRSNFGSIAIFEDYIYWRDGLTAKMYRANKCDGAELTELITTYGSGREVKVYHFSEQPAVANACAGRIEQCSHLCLPTPGIGNATLSSICACPDGHTLSSDGHNCS